MKKIFSFGVLVSTLALTAQSFAMNETPQAVINRIIENSRQQKMQIEEQLREVGGDALVNYFRLKVLQGLPGDTKRKAGLNANYASMAWPLEYELLRYRNRYKEGNVFTEGQARQLQLINDLIARYLPKYKYFVGGLIEEFPTERAQWGDMVVQPITVAT